MDNFWQSVAIAPVVMGQAAFIFTSLLSQPVQSQSSPITRCRYNPRSGIANPLGMRTLVTLTEAEGTTEITYEQLGARVPGPVEAVLTSQRSLTLVNTSIEQARQLLLNTPSYYQELVGFNDPEGFAPVNDSLICTTQVAVQPRVPRQDAASELPDLSSQPSRSPLPNLGAPPTPPTDNSSAPVNFYGTVAGLADGNYRYVSGPADERAYSDQELLNRGGILFVFRKTGDEIIGSYSYIDGEAICVTGRVSGNTVSGQAYPYDGGARDLGEEFAFWGPATFLRVRRTRGEEGARYFSSATLELNDFSRINAGSSLPPSSCN